MKKRTKVILGSVLAAVLLWICTAAIDLALVCGEHTPVFCIEHSSYAYQESDYHEYRGLGYTLVTRTHPVSGRREFCYTLLGQALYDNYTNDASVVAVDAS